MIVKYWSLWKHLSLALLVLAAAQTAAAADKKPKPKAEDFQKVELFSAMKTGELEVQLIPKDATVATLLIRNKSDKPLSVKLPEAFAGVPVLAQFGGGGGGLGGGGLGGGGLGGGGQGGGGGGQGLGGGLGGGGQGGGGFGGGGGGLGGGGGGFGGGGGGFFNVEPDKVGKIKANTVCLEHGKPDPTSHMKYTIIPIDTFTKDQRVVEVCKMLGRGEIPQNAAQAAAWHFTNGMSWQELAGKDKFRSQFTGEVRKFFSPLEMDLAMRIANAATTRADEAKSNSIASPGESTSSGSKSGTTGSGD